MTLVKIFIFLYVVFFFWTHRKSSGQFVCIILRPAWLCNIAFELPLSSKGWWTTGWSRGIWGLKKKNYLQFWLIFLIMWIVATASKVWCRYMSVSNEPEKVLTMLVSCGHGHHHHHGHHNMELTYPVQTHRSWWCWGTCQCCRPARGKHSTQAHRLMFICICIICISIAHQSLRC